jgi:hypothetical protein
MHTLQGTVKGIAMRNRHALRQLRSAAAVAITLALAIGWSATKSFAEDDDEDVPLDTKILRQLLKDWGLQRAGSEVGIDYQERAPLVVPPSRNLPPPQNETAVTSNPAWPSDPDVKRRKQQAAAEKARLKAGVISGEDQGRALRPEELDAPGRKASSGQPAAPGRTAEDIARPMSPDELGSKNVFSKLFSSIGPSKEEQAPFTGEPPRTSMTAPPAGYQTPSPNQPYGVGVAKHEYKAMRPEDQAVGGWK